MTGSSPERPAPLEGVTKPTRLPEYSSDSTIYDAGVEGKIGPASVPVSETEARSDLMHKASAPSTASFMVITVSDTRTYETDLSGDRIQALIAEAGYSVALYRIVKDDAADLERVLLDGIESADVEVIVVSGGTGMSRRDGTYEVVSRLLDKRLEGFGEIFRTLSYQQIGSAAMLSRAVAGISRGKPVFSIPGSPRAAELAMRNLILPETGHLLLETRR